ncbi:unnamed protein product [Parascedosporium putredinis]|uniref:Glucose-methanol-choline oxidoreductase N-terminal domain-containing protein n=1 Tax=Parascedosporium putredinis TaxID=1442378 RepID=A0A9P1MBR9_9PEZI|nr:unnamed protein product [Parascedosporium putredinis]CAI7995315.1 unnamed protein product [Parascedosporium putredinis]
MLRISTTPASVQQTTTNPPSIIATGAVAENDRAARSLRSARRAAAQQAAPVWPSPRNWDYKDEPRWDAGSTDQSAAARQRRRPQMPEEPETPVETVAPPKEEEEPEEPCTPVGEDEVFDYVVIGGGAGGIPVAERLVQAGHKVLLLEKGPASTARWGGNLKPDWLEGEDLTRFDVPGLCNQIWHDSTGIVCSDMDQFAGCILGGGTAINAGLWWKPHPLDWDDNFPEGWKASDVESATNRVFTRIPGTTHPSMDGYLYQDEGFNVLADGLANSGWERLDTPNAHPDKKNHTFGHTTFMFSNGERGGPLATYLVTASRNPNFSLWTNTAARRLIRDGDRVTGIELECNGATGRSGTIKVADTGRLTIVQRSALDGESMVAEEQWLELPVGENLIDHLNTDVVVEHPNVYQYNYTAAWATPDENDVALYLRDRSGILAAAAPNIGPMIWDEVELSDGSTRQLQWTCRMEGSLDYFGNHTITMSMYLGRGVVSRGRMGLTPALTSRVISLPYLKNGTNDLEALAKGLDNIRNSLADVPDLTFLSPADNITTDQYLEDYVVNVGRRSNHWMGTAKMGTDDGREEDGTAVVDADTKVYGVDNLFIVDASIFPGMVTGNPSAMIVIVAERAAERILALELPAAEAPEEEEEAPEEEAPEEEAPEEEAPADEE